MGTLTAALFLLQQLEAVPFPVEVGEQVSIRVRDASGPRAGIAVAVEDPDGSRRQLGSTDARGEVAYVPQATGLYCYRAEVDAVRLLAPHRVVQARRRWLEALVWVPVGLGLCWGLLRRAQKRAAT